MDKNNKKLVDNNKVVEIINKYYDIQWSLDIILDMVKEPYDKKKKTETPLEYIKRKVPHYYVDDDVPKNDRLNPEYNNEIHLQTGCECHEDYLLSPIVNYINKNISGIVCDYTRFDSSAYLVINTN